MEKDLTTAATLRRAALSRGSVASRATARPASAKASAKAGVAAEAASAQAKEPSKGAAKGATRQRQIQETRAQMLERLTNPLLSLHEASVLLRVCSATVRRLANDGSLAHIRTPGGQRRFYLRDVLQVLEERDGERYPTARAKKRSAARPSARVLARPATAPQSAESERSLEARALLEATRARLRGAPAQAPQAARRSSSDLSAPQASAREAAARLTSAPRLPLRLGAVRARLAEPARESEEAGAAQDATESARQSRGGRGR